MGERIVIERTDAEHQFHVRFVAGNGQRTFWCENLKTRASANSAIRRHAETFLGRGNASVLKLGTPSHVWVLQVSGDGFDNQIPIEYLDSRTKKA